MKTSPLMAEFLAWREETDGEGVLDIFDLALGFYYGRYPKRRHQLACDFAAKARELVRPLTLDEVKDALAKGAAERRLAERTLKRSPRR